MLMVVHIYFLFYFFQISCMEYEKIHAKRIRCYFSNETQNKNEEIKVQINFRYENARENDFFFFNEYRRLLHLLFSSSDRRSNECIMQRTHKSIFFFNSLNSKRFFPSKLNHSYSYIVLNYFVFLSFRFYFFLVFKSYI